MRKIELAEVKEKQATLGFTPAFIYNIEKGRVELFEYENEEERESLLAQDWCYSSENDRVVALRINGARLVDQETELADQQLKELMDGTHMKLYKKLENFLPYDSIKCGEVYEQTTGKRVKHIGVRALLGDYLMVSINGRLHRFKENNHEYVGLWN